MSAARGVGKPWSLERLLSGGRGHSTSERAEPNKRKTKERGEREKECPHVPGEEQHFIEVEYTYTYTYIGYAYKFRRAVPQVLAW